MAASILSFGSRALPRSMPWQNQDYAEFYRVRDRLNDAGYAVETDSGLSDEGEPWFVFQRAGSDDILVHIARIDRELIVVNGMTGQVFRGGDFRGVVDRLLDGAELVLPQRLDRNSKVVLHPSMVLTAFVAAAFLLGDQILDGQAEAATTAHAPADGSLMSALHAGASEASHADAPAVPGAAVAGRRVAKEASGLSHSAGAPYSPLHDVAGSAPAIGLSVALFAAELSRLISSESRESIALAAEADGAVQEHATGFDTAAVTLAPAGESAAGDAGAVLTNDRVSHLELASADGTSEARVKEAVASLASVLQQDDTKDRPLPSEAGSQQAQAAEHMHLQPAAATPAAKVIEISTAADVTTVPVPSSGEGAVDTHALLSELFTGAAIDSVLLGNGEAVITLRLDPSGPVSTSVEAVSGPQAVSTSGTGVVSAAATVANGASERHADMNGPLASDAAHDPAPASQPVIFSLRAGNDDAPTVPGHTDRSLSFADGVAETVAFADGHTVVDGFRLGEDKIDLSNLFASGHHVVVAIEGVDIVMVEDGGNSITLVGVLAPDSATAAVAA